MDYITGYCRIKNFVLADNDKIIFAGKQHNSDVFLDEAFAFLSGTYAKFYKMDRLSKLGFLGTEVLLKGRDLLKHYGAAEVALVLSNAHASLDTDLKYFESTKTMASPALFVYTLTNIVTGEICIRHGIKGENAFFVMPGFDSIQLYEYVTSVMGSGKTRACIAGWIDVMGDQHDVFLYLVENQKNAAGLEHTAEQLQKLYQLNYGKVDGRS